MSGSLHKLVIHCFRDKSFTDEMKSKKFVAPINPESFTKNIVVELETKTPHGSPGQDPKFTGAGREELRLEFILDGTGTMEGYLGPKKKDKDGKETGEDVSIHTALEQFLECVMYDGDIHRPKFLILFWGSEIKFPCVVSNLDINHTLFDPLGFPVRVKITATFVGYKTPAALIAAKQISSADLTHYKKIKSGDRLDLLTYGIYNDSKYFFQVARANGLSSLRNLQPGINISFPPFDKKEA